MTWNGDCKVEGCERECVDSSGYCKKHKPTGEWTVADREWHMENGVLMDANGEQIPHGLLDARHNAALAAAEDEFTRYHHNNVSALVAAYKKQLADVCKVSQDSQKALWEAIQQLAAEREKVRESDAAVCSLLALAAVVKGNPETPQALKDLASKELLDHNRGAYLIEELRTLRADLAAEREKSEKLVEYGVKLDDWNDKLQEQLAAERNAKMEWAKSCLQLREQLAAAYAKSEEPRCDFVSHLELEHERS